MREEIKHELMHIINDDFYVDHHVNLVERMVRMSQIEDVDLNGIDFYHHEKGISISNNICIMFNYDG